MADAPRPLPELKSAFARAVAAEELTMRRRHVTA
jgi:hypothetical protein